MSPTVCKLAFIIITLSFYYGLSFAFLEPRLLTDRNFTHLQYVLAHHPEAFERYNLSIDPYHKNCVCYKKDKVSYPVYVSRRAGDRFTFTYIGPFGSRSYTDHEITANKYFDLMLFGNRKDRGAEKLSLLKKIDKLYRER